MRFMHLPRLFHISCFQFHHCSFWISDEYGPYIYKFSKQGKLEQVIQPPKAILPHDAKDALNFTADSNPTTGRAPNQGLFPMFFDAFLSSEPSPIGLEGLSYDPSTETLYALLQSSTWQDGGPSKATNRFTRLLAYDLSTRHKRHDGGPKLVGEWVVPLPRNAKNNTLATSELLFVKKNVFLSLSRDGDGRGGEDAKSKYKHVPQ